MCDPIFITACKLADLPMEMCVCAPVYMGVSTGNMECCTASCHTSETGSLQWGKGRVTVLNICVLIAGERVVSTTLRILM